MRCTGNSTQQNNTRSSYGGNLGDKLVDEGCIKGIKEKLVPNSYLVTPNSFEAEILSGKKISSIEDQEYAAKEIKIWEQKMF